MSKVLGYAGRKPRRQNPEGGIANGAPKHTIWPGLHIAKGFHAEGNVIKPDVLRVRQDLAKRR